MTSVAWFWFVKLKSLLPFAVVLSAAGATGLNTPELISFADATGLIATYQTGGGRIDLTGPFFQPLAASGRSCATCHRPAQGWTISAAEVKARFADTKGLDPIFRTNDGSNCDRNIDTSTVEGRRAAYRLLLERALVRVPLRVPADAEFEVVGVENPYGCNDRTILSVYRRPLPATNLRLLSSVMWDGRESSPQTGTRTITAKANAADLQLDLAHQAMNAASTHAGASSRLTSQQQHALVDFEMGLATAQAVDEQAGLLDANGAKGGPVLLAAQTIATFFPGINDPLAGDTHAIKAENAIRIFDAWSARAYGRVYNQAATAVEAAQLNDARDKRRASIARGQLLFNQQPFDIRGVAGLNDERNSASITGACGTCHNSPNAGNHSLPEAMNTGVAERNGPLDISYLPAITLRNRMTGEQKVTTDPGRALVTGLWSDVGKMKTPVLRGLAARAPYFHNGSAQTLADVVDFYDKRFHAGFSEVQKQDLVAFLSTL